MPFWRKNKPSPSPADASRDLRDQALSVTASDLGISPTPELPNVFGVLMETGYPEAVATLASFAEGSTSLYFSTGGGIIGAGEHDSVRAQVGPFLGMVQAHLAEFRPATAAPLPETGQVRFYVRTYSGNLTADANEQDLGEMRHVLSPVFHAGHNVITAVREVSE